MIGAESNKQEPIDGDGEAVQYEPLSAQNELVLWQVLSSMNPFPLPSAFPELEDYILALRPAGVTLKEVSSKLANEGHLNANGEPYNTSTICKAEKRAKARKGQEKGRLDIAWGRFQVGLKTMVRDGKLVY